MSESQSGFVGILTLITSGVIGWLFVRFVFQSFVLERREKLKREAELERFQDRPAPKAPPQLPPLPTLSPLSVSLSIHSDQSPPTPRSHTPQAPSQHVIEAIVSSPANNATLRRRPIPVVHDTHEHLAPLLGARSSREPNVNEHVDSIASLPRSSEHHQGLSQDSRLRLDHAPTVPPSSSGVARSNVDEWRKVVALGLVELDEERGQDQPMPSVVDGRPLPSSPTVSVVPTLPPFVPPPALLDEVHSTPLFPDPATSQTNPVAVPQPPNSAVLSSAKSEVFTPPPQLPFLSTSTNAGASSTEISVLEPWNGALATQDRELDVLTSVSATATSFQTDGIGDSSSTSQLLVTPPDASGVLSSMLTFTQSIHKSPQPPTPPYFLTSSAQHPDHLHYSPPSNIVALAPSATTAAPAAIAPTHSHTSKSSPPASTISSLSQSVSLNQEQGIEDPTSLRPFSFSEPFDLVIPESPGLQGSITPPSSLQSPFIPLSIPCPPLPILPVPQGAGGNGTKGGQQRQPLSLLGSASSVMTTTTRQPYPPQPSNTTSMIYSLTEDGSTTTTICQQTSPTSLPARLPPPAVQPDGVLLAFPSEVNYQQQHGFASPGIMSPMLSELDFVSDDDIGSESSWSSDSCRDAHT